MARWKKLSIGAINITTHPHSPENYIRLFTYIFQNDLKEKIHGASWGTIGTLRDREFRNQIILFGTIYRYLNIDPNSDWLDTLRRQPISHEEEDFAPPLPNHLKPHLKYISYLFLSREHRFFFDSGGIKPQSMRNFLLKLFEQEGVNANFGEVDVTIESTREAIRRILSIPRLTRLEIFFNRPNADDLTRLEQRVVDRITSQNIKHLRQFATTTDADGIQADNETKALMNVARSNGKVIGSGYARGQKITHSTEDHPMIETIEYDPDREDRLSAMLQAATTMIGRIRDR